ncbi:hypothetical protein [Comamonas kerstersii]|uniref:hypothetical protein n=1 Tax=Comamonas kerstersii TaxID=225992 RepID=UPI0013B05EF1|nr:hypothetical protein [Comamonas kerstersii]
MAEKKDPTIKFSMTEIGKLLIREAKFTEGRYEVAVGFKVGVGVVGPTENEALPGAIIGVQDIGLSRVADDASGPMILDAAVISAQKTSRKSKKSS